MRCVAVSVDARARSVPDDVCDVVLLVKGVEQMCHRSWGRKMQFKVSHEIQKRVGERKLLEGSIMNDVIIGTQ
jgi:hypothetical protein